MGFLTLMRIFSYLLIILISFGFLRRNIYRHILAGNMLVSCALLANAIDSQMYSKMPPDSTIFVIINIAVFLWAILYVVEFFRHKESDDTR